MLWPIIDAVTVVRLEVGDAPHRFERVAHARAEAAGLPPGFQAQVDGDIGLQDVGEADGGEAAASFVAAFAEPAPAVACNCAQNLARR